jgi:membrane fusion protein, copper/silver efflux system
MSESFAKQTLTVLQVLFARLRFIAVFIVAAVIVGYWDNIKNHVDKWTRPAIAPDSLASVSASNIEYYCPMHPDVIRNEPGQCPKCGMPLVKRKKGEALVLPADVLARVQLTPQRVALGDVQTTPVEYLSLHREIRALGVLDYDETKLARISSRVAGRADDLFVTFTGQAVKRGDPLYSIYSPEVYTGLREYLLNRKRVNELPKDAPSDTKMDASAVYSASLDKLILWGISTEQLDKLDDEYDRTGKVATHLTVDSPISGIVIDKAIDPGQYVQVGQAPYTVADMSDLWLLIKLYERDIPLVRVGDTIDVTVDAFPSQTFKAVVSFKAFQLDPETRTLDARVVVQNPGLNLRPGMFATATVRVPVVASLAAATLPPTEVAKAYAAALAPYLEAQGLLAQDKSARVAELLQASVEKLSPVKQADAVAPDFEQLSGAVARMKGEDIAGLRDSFKDVSAAMIEIGKSAGIPEGGAAIRIFHCPMKKANWLQLGEVTANPYYGAEMPTCGNAVEALPRATVSMPATRPAMASGKMLAVPRSAVIDTGENRIVYVRSSPGAYDMRAVKLGPLAQADRASVDGIKQEYYPVLQGLNDGDLVVTRGTFLVDAENRLNPARENMPSSAPAGAAAEINKAGTRP